MSIVLRRSNVGIFTHTKLDNDFYVNSQMGKGVIMVQLQTLSGGYGYTTIFSVSYWHPKRILTDLMREVPAKEVYCNTEV